MKGLFFIPGALISLLTFPGVMVHEWAHAHFCRKASVPILKVCYFRLGNPAGYVIHGKVRNYRDLLLIDLGPFIVNSVLAFVTGFLAIIAYAISSELLLPFLWLAVSIGMHAFPSTQDANNLWNASKKSKSMLRYASYPAVIFIKIANVLSFFWFDLFYAWFVAYLPVTILNLLL